MSDTVNQNQLPEETPVFEGEGGQWTGLPQGFLSADATYNPNQGRLVGVTGYAEAPGPMIRTSSLSPLACSCCGAIDAPVYYLRRRRGLYAVLCFRYGQGCWESSPRQLCSHTEPDGTACPNLCEYELVADGLVVARPCIQHVGHSMPAGARRIELYSLD